MYDRAHSSPSQQLREYREIKLDLSLLSPELSSCLVSACAGNGLTGPQAEILFRQSQAVIALGGTKYCKQFKRKHSLC